MKDDSENRAKDRAEAAKVRKRWITLGEVLGVAAVLISGLTLWNNWSDRRETKAEKAATEQRASAKVAKLVLVAADGGKQTLALKPAAAEQSVQSQTILFPSALAVSPAATTGEPRIEGGWFEHALVKAREAAGLADNSRGDERLPVVIVTQYLADGDPHEDVALYDVGYTISGKFLGGHSVTLRGISLVAKVKRDHAQARLDARWKTLLPPAK
ncbi:hypothetical protein CA233_13660 [Sphingomonas sp. ABOLD]|uniref:Uncharacterized protein n=1 Tax=Sphingomonas trueperi TaxID=53317 RepID=A0A7X5Y0Z1_9SPHN|nr:MULTISPECIES: hypothetical protein [Sphingomonas]NJB97431.1 hypothetical protein [Sphingomonas trueperi]RSV35583.1 hypothetical protein CA234_19660 [Sphingomonas sp. ABOLE]RSV45941.1 hypothetical protein CA233_13660 [Sphingomonas sp. ABOLD]